MSFYSLLFDAYFFSRSNYQEVRATWSFSQDWRTRLIIFTLEILPHLTTKHSAWVLCVCLSTCTPQERERERETEHLFKLVIKLQTSNLGSFRDRGLSKLDRSSRSSVHRAREFYLPGNSGTSSAEMLRIFCCNKNDNNLFTFTRSEAWKFYNNKKIGCWNFLSIKFRRVVRNWKCYQTILRRLLILI